MLSRSSHRGCSRALAVTAALALAAFAAAPAHAGVLCGTVRDRVTAAPVPRAGVFLRTTAGAYTGLHGATDAAGRFCIASVPAGTYDVEVRVDDYRIGYKRNVVVTDAPVDVGVDATLPAIRLEVAPEPAREHVVFSLYLVRPAPVQLEVFDAAGRRVRGWSASPVVGNRVFTWDFRDHAGRALPSGHYRVRLVSGSTVVVRSLTHLK